LKFRAGPFHAGIGSGERFQVELQVAQIGGAGGRRGDSFLRRDQHARDLEALGERDALDRHPPGKHGGGGSAGQAQRSAGEPAHALGITNADAIGAHVDVVAERFLGVIDAAGEAQGSATGFGADIVEVQAGRVEDQVALHSAKPGGKICCASRHVFNMHAPGDARAVESPFEGRVDLGLATRVQFRHVATEKAQVQAPVQSQTQSAASGKLHGPGNLEVGVLTLKRDGFYVERVARCAEVNQDRKSTRLNSSHVAISYAVFCLKKKKKKKKNDNVKIEDK